MSEDILNQCKANPLVSFVQSQVGYVCGAQAVTVLAEFDCISIAVRTKTECRNHIHGLPLPELQAGKCSQMPQFFKCLEPEVYQQCGTSGLSTLIQAIAGFGCDISFYQLGKTVNLNTMHPYHYNRHPTITTITFDMNIVQQQSIIQKYMKLQH